MSSPMNKASSVAIAGISVRQDREGRYSLNDLHKAAGKERRHEPSLWLRNQQTADLVAELETTQIPVVSLTGRKGGTYVCKELVYAYAMWISARFHLQVIRAYDALVAGEIELAEGRASRATARLEAPFMSDAVKHQRDVIGKPVMHYHFSNEFDLINRIGLGMTAKEYRAKHGLAANDAIRDFLTPCEIKCIEHLQRVNASMIDIGMDYADRKTRLSQIYIQRHAARLCAEVHRLEA